MDEEERTQMDIGDTTITTAPDTQMSVMIPRVPSSQTIVRAWNELIIVDDNMFTNALPLNDELSFFTRRRDKYHQKRIERYIQQRRSRPPVHLCLLVSDTSSRPTHPSSRANVTKATPTITDEIDSVPTKVICTTDPIGRTKKLNEEGNRYRLSMIIGPFGPQNGLSGKAFESIMQRLATDKHGRIVIGVKMAVHYKLDVCGIPSREQLLVELQKSKSIVSEAVRAWDPSTMSSGPNQIPRKFYNVRVS
jgi:hypothetical protein